METNKETHLIKKNLMTLAIMSLFFAFTFFVFGTLQLYIQNIGGFEFTINAVIVPVAITFCAVFLVVFLFGLLLKGKFKEWYIYLIFGGTLALYIQGNFVFTDYGILNGTPINWGNYQTTAIWNTIMWIVCIIAPFIARAITKKNISLMLTLIAGCILLVQSITLVSLVVTTDFSTNEASKAVYLSKQGINDLSQQQNVVIYILDSFDADFMDEIIADEPEILNPLHDFTNYRNATSYTPYSVGSTAYMLTGKTYRNEKPYPEYLEEAFNDAQFYKKMDSMGYDFGIYAETSYIGHSFLENYVENAVFEKKVLSSYRALGAKMIKFTAFKYFPHILKPFVWLDTETFADIMIAPEGGEPPFSSENIEYYTDLQREGLKINESEKSFRYIHLNGAHMPYVYSEDLTLIPESEGSSKQSTRASLKMFSLYQEEMKKLGVYDNTEIFLLADHGEGSISAERRGDIMFLHKPIGASSESMTYSNAPVSQSDIWPTISKALDLGIEIDTGYPLDEIAENSQRIRKHFYTKAWHSDYIGEYFYPIHVYDIMPNNRELRRYNKTDEVYEMPH